MQHCAFSFKSKKQLLDDDDGSFEGLLAVYNNVDLGGDVVMPGAFTKTLQEHGSQVPLLWQHRTDNPIGTLSLTDSPNGLQAKGKLLLVLPQAQAAYQLLKSGVIRGLSIGYDTITEGYENGVRQLKELRLWEGSVVTFPMNPEAMVLAVKANDEDAEIIAAVKALTVKAEQMGAGTTGPGHLSSATPHSRRFRA
ncbi:MAG TPA: HK97 family phage prohead protease [Patescibacteria group bacterium]|nr:HK97 family phage prohead protease [Patescibacteria group bacterium]